MVWLGVAMGRVFLGTRLALMGWRLILINGFGTGLKIFLKTRGGFGYRPTPSRPNPIIYKINF